MAGRSGNGAAVCGVGLLRASSALGTGSWSRSRHLARSRSNRSRVTVTGKLKEVAGDVTNDPKLRREGLEEERTGEKKEDLAEADRKADQKADEVAEAERRTA